jgi:hypothetical protein
MADHSAYPLTIEGELDPQTSRWLWLVKWLLLIPHYIALAVLWIAFVLMSVVAFFAILFTGRYPKGIFDFNVGVLRWTWRASFYGYEALGTDRYPPFTLNEVPDYPARLSVVYPANLSRGLVLVKWWLLAIPHYLIVSVLVGGAYFAMRERVFAGMGVIDLLVIVAALALLFTGGYPRGIFDLVMGLNRWVYRVGAYAGLMTDEYPPFRLDQGGTEFAGALPPAPPGAAPIAGERPAPGPRGAGSIIAIVVGALIALVSLGLLTGGGVLLWVDRTQRDSAGFATTPTEEFTTASAAVVSEDVDFRVEGPGYLYPSRILGDTRLRATAQNGKEIFIGIAPSRDADRYLVAPYAEVSNFFEGDIKQREPGNSPEAMGPPIEEDFWEASATGDGTQELVWDVGNGRWTIVVMNADASPGVAVEADLGAELPALPWVAIGLLIAGLVLATIATALIVYGTRHGRSRAPAPSPSA